jgi:hypothetical protein
VGVDEEAWNRYPWWSTTVPPMMADVACLTRSEVIIGAPKFSA